MDRRITVTLMAIAMAVLLASCSVVFQAGISGKVVTDSGTGTAAVSNVNVFAYTDEGLRNSDYDKFVEGSITRPSSGAGYVATTSTNANGEFTVNKVVWETKKSEFGKTADVNKLYLIFYHEDYKPAKYDATVISDSTNADNVYVKLEASKYYTTINLTVNNVSTNQALGAPCTLKYWVGDSTEYDTITFTGTTSFQVSFPISVGSSTTIKYWLESSGTHWEMSNKSGELIDADTCVSETIAEGTHSVTLFMKKYEYTIPSFSGDMNLKLSDKIKEENIDDVPVYLFYHDGTDWKVFSETVSANNVTTSTQVTSESPIYYTHGHFANVGRTANNTIVVNSDSDNDYKDIVDWDNDYGKTVTFTLGIGFDFRVFDSNNVLQSGDIKIYKFTYTPGSGNTYYSISTSTLTESVTSL